MKIRLLLAHRYFPHALAALAMAMVLPSLAVGLQFDDYLLRQTILAAPDFFSAINRPFIFMDGSADRARQLMDSGAFPWWALPDGQVAFWRPLAALTHWIDFRFWPKAFPLMHAQNVLWFGALIFVVAVFYRQLVPNVWVAGLAALLYALDDAHGLAVGWLSNRNVLMAMLFGVLALIAHDRWRRGGWRVGAVAAPVLFALGLFSAEAAVATLAYLIAYAIFLDRASPSNRALSLLPCATVALLWRLTHQLLGFGAWGTSYIDPAREPARYFQAVIERGPILLLAQWAQPPAELYPYLSRNAAALWWAVAVVVLIALAFLLRPLLQRDLLARFWAAGMMLSLLPPSSSLPANRLLFFVGLGAMGLLAQYTLPMGVNCAHSSNGLANGKTDSDGRHPFFRFAEQSVGSWARNAIVRLFIFLHLILAPLLLPLTAFSPALLGNIEPSIKSLPDDPDFAAQTAVIVGAPSFFYTGYIADIRSFQDLPTPARVRTLASGLTAITLSRADSNTVLVRPVGGYLTGFDTVFRGGGQPMRLGQAVALTGVTITVQELTDDGRPAAVSFRFDAPLEDRSLRWFQWQNGIYAPFAPPAAGETVVVSHGCCKVP